MKYTLFAFYFFLISTILLNASNTQSLPENISQKALIGQNIFKKKLKRKCGFTAARFAQSHTQEEWKKLKDEGQFRIEVYKMCPKTVDVLQDNWIDPLYEFSMVFASDSGIYPSC